MPAIVVVLAAAVKEPEVSEKSPLISTFVQPLKFNVPPAMVTAFEVPVNPVNPEKLLPVFIVSVPVVCVNVPVPESTPDRVIPSGIVGFAPKGKVHNDPIVFTPVCPVKLTDVKVMLLHVSEAVPPGKVKIALEVLPLPAILLKVP